jgi:hypothetical protein
MFRPSTKISSRTLPLYRGLELKIHFASFTSKNQMIYIDFEQSDQTLTRLADFFLYNHLPAFLTQKEDRGKRCRILSSSFDMNG